ncbi:MAG: four helix bundle protein [Bacteroidia bacterium]|nr:four helix bundle protein [Bacteroidia bacterium]MDW8300967.1 four helix bundle protein [Bacteroidia bacterium]
MKTRIEHYKDLEVWQRAFRLATQVANKYENTELAQRSHIIKNLIEKSLQIPALISEGFLRGVLPEYVACLKTARHIVSEIDMTLQILPALNMATEAELQELVSEYEIVARQISTLTSILSKKMQSNNRPTYPRRHRSQHTHGNHSQQHHQSTAGENKQKSDYEI